MSVPDSVLHDVQPVNALMRAFYELISFEEGGQPDWPRTEQLFSPHARITRLTPEGTDYMDLAGFRSMAEELMEVGAFTSFYERELARRTDRYGTVMHIASAYETKISPDAGDYIERGVNSLQLIWERDRWRIISLCWDAHGPCELDGMRPVLNGGVQDGQG